MNAIKQGVYFHSDEQRFSHVAICLAEGLQQIGIPIYSNIDYTHPSSSVRFIPTSDISLLENSYCTVMTLENICELFPYRVNQLECIHNKTLSLCMHDNLSNFLIDPEIPLLCTHENEFRRNDGIRIPIAFGLNQAMIKQTFNLPEFTDRENYVLRSFHPSLRQDVRSCLDLSLIPSLQYNIPVETRYTTLQSDFMTLLSKTKYCLSYGGCFSQNISLTPVFQAMEACREFYSHITFTKDTVVDRWDSWRFWESLVSGCVTIHLDFEKYGFKLPVMPENWKHYIGLDLANIHRDVERMLDEQEQMQEIAYNGRLWALEHYSPIAVAKRFLKTIELLYPNKI